MKILVIGELPLSFNDQLVTLNHQLTLCANTEQALPLYQQTYYPLILLSLAEQPNFCRLLYDLPEPREYRGLFVIFADEDKVINLADALTTIIDDIITLPLNTALLQVRFTILERRICQRAQYHLAEASLPETYSELELQIKERTAELYCTNLTLQKEVITRRQIEESLRQRAKQLLLINEISNKIAAVSELETLLNRAVQLIQETFNYHHVALFLIEGEVLQLRAIAGLYKG